VLVLLRAINFIATQKMSDTNTPAASNAMQLETNNNNDSSDDTKHARTLSTYKAPQFIPIQIDISYNHLRLKDSFLWNKDDHNVTIEEFARRLCEDLDFPPQIFVPPVVRSMRAQIEFYSSDPTTKKEDDEEENTNNKKEDNGEKRYLIKVIRKQNCGGGRT
jgi:hypothetical protein